MKLFLASTAQKPYLQTELKNVKYILESFYYIKDWQIPFINGCESFLLDSGAFTFMQGKNVNWDDYSSKYADFINAYKVKNFFELDIDSIVGYEEVKKLRRKIELATGRQCIPVWHRSRGADEYIRLCEEYPYIAIGGFAIKDIKRSEYKHINVLLEKARTKNTKVHGLGFTPTNVNEHDFYSVDSSSWTSGSRFASIYQFANGKMINLNRKANTRLVDYKSLDKHNLNQWIKFQMYLDKGEN